MILLVGQEVYHATFGIGTVKNVPTEGRPYAEVKFGVNTKTLKTEMLSDVPNSLRPAPPLFSEPCIPARKITVLGSPPQKKYWLLSATRATKVFLRTTLFGHLSNGRATMLQKSIQ